ncbi:60kDa protein [Agapanthus velarivirus]|nr:60kDa protein [Agapanthus velarivirus]
MDITKNDNVRRIFSRLLYSRNPSTEIEAVSNSLVSEGSQSIPLSYTGRSSNTSKLFSTIVSIRNNIATISDDDVTTCVTLFIYYLKTVKKLPYELYSPYPPENLLLGVNSHQSLAYKDKFIGKTITDMCMSDPNTGCKYSYPSIRQKNPNKTETEINLLYKIQNAFGKEVDLDSVAEDELKLFRIDRKDLVVEKTQTSALEIIRQAITYVENYFRYTEDEMLTLNKQAKQSIFSTPYLGLSEAAKTLCDTSVICKGALYTNFDEFKLSSVKDSKASNILKYFNKTIAPVLSKLFATSFYSSLNTFVETTPVSFDNVLTDPDTLLIYMNQLNSLHANADTVHKLNDESDEIVLNRCTEFFRRKFDIDSKAISEALTLLFFSFLTTSPGIRKRREWFCVEFQYNRSRKLVEFFSDEFVSFIDGIRDQLVDGDSERNYIRLFCSKRANKAIKVNEYFNFKPKLFSKYADILDHLRIDFYKGLDTRALTHAECESLHKLQVLTEYRTNRTEESRNLYLNTIGLI